MSGSAGPPGAQGYAVQPETDPNEDVKFGTLLHKEGLWSLYGTKGTASRIYHMCRDQKLRTINAVVNSFTYRCHNCGILAPDEIKGLFQLHNFEEIQERGPLHYES